MVRCLGTIVDDSDRHDDRTDNNDGHDRLELLCTTFPFSGVAFASGIALFSVGCAVALYREPCVAIGWEGMSDGGYPKIVDRDLRSCATWERYRHYRGRWTFGEWSDQFQPTDGDKTASGTLLIDEAARNLIFDDYLKRYISPIAGAEIEIDFDGNELTSAGRSKNWPGKIYLVRRIHGARLISASPE